jgi:hypothetical protein
MTMFSLSATFLLLLSCGNAIAATSIERAQMYCAPKSEMSAMLNGFTVKMRGASGLDSENGAELWTNPDGLWFMIQVIPARGLMCVVLGGKSHELIDQSKEGDPA